MRAFDPAMRRAQYRAFDVFRNSTAGTLVDLNLAGRSRRIYANANLSVVSDRACNAACPFCIEKVRPASRGRIDTHRRPAGIDDERYFIALERCLAVLSGLNHSISLTGGEPSLDPRLAQLLELFQRCRLRKRTMTTNGSGLLQAATLDIVAAAGLAHLNLSRAHPDDGENHRLMGARDLPSAVDLCEIASILRGAGTRMRLSCALQAGGIADFRGVLDYLDFAAGIGIDNVVFRQLMRTDPRTAAAGPVAYSEAHRVGLEPLFAELDARADFSFVRQVVGYYYYVEVWRWRGIDIVFEAADLGWLEDARRAQPEVVHEFVFHPDGRLCSTWQADDGLLLGAGPGQRANSVGRDR